MITPSFSLTATERVLPRLALDFTTASLDPRITLTRALNTATAINSSGVIASVNANLPRFDYNPSTFICKGLLIEEARTNVLLASLIDGTSLVTQSVVVTAAQRTLSFYGTGQIVLSGAHSATVTGTGAYPTRTTLVFTPSAGTLTLTVSGTVQYAQLELGSFATSFIPTAGTAVTRNADVVTMTGTNFSDWYNQTQGAFAVSFDRIAAVSSSFSGGLPRTLRVTNTGATDFFILSGNSASGEQLLGRASGVDTVSIQSGVMIAANTVATECFGYAVNNFALAINGAATQTDVSGANPTNMDILHIGDGATATRNLNGHVLKIMYWPQRLTNNEVRAFSK